LSEGQVLQNFSTVYILDEFFRYKQLHIVGSSTMREKIWLWSLDCRDL